LKARDGLLVEAVRVRKEVEERVSYLKTLLVSDEINITSAEKELVTIEKQEKLKVVKTPRSGGRLGMLVSLTKNRIDELKASLRTMRDQRDIAEHRVKLLQDILSQFKEEYNPNFNDAGVKKAVRAWESYAASGTLPPPDTHFNNEVESRLLPEDEQGIIWEEYEEGDTEASICELLSISTGNLGLTK
jgi:protein kinase C substrate 80K-H